MKKVLIFSTAYLPLIGGAEIAVKEITKRLPDWQFDLITAKIKPGLSKFEKIGNINVYRVGFGLGFFDKYYLAFFGNRFAQKLHKEKNYNLIWAMMASYNGFAALFFKKKNKKIPFLLTLQEGDKLKYILKRARPLKKQFVNIFKQADYIQAISCYLANWAKNMKAKCPIEVVPNGVDIANFSAKFPNKRDKNLIMAGCSRLEKKNAVDAVIKSLQYLPKVKLLVMGDGKDRIKLEKLATKIKVKDRVTFFGEYNNDQLPKHLSFVSAFVRPSLSEGQGIAFLEAMAAGVPIIGTPVGGIVDLLKDRETGLFCKVNDPQDIAKKIKEILNNNNLRDCLISNSRELIKREYDWDKISQQMENIFNKL